MSFYVGLEYGSEESVFALPSELLLPALPAEGTAITFRHIHEGAEVEFEVLIEEVFIDATNLSAVRYKAFVIPTD